MAGPPVSGPSETARVEAFSDAVFINPWESLAVHGFLIAFFLLPVRKPTSRRPAM
jgi:hypothetical protein